MTTRLVSLLRVAIALVIVTAWMALAGEAAQPLQIVHAGPHLYCLFSTGCEVNVKITHATFTLEGTGGYGVLYTKVFKAASGSPAEGWWGYEYRVDLSDVQGILAPNCIDAMRIPVGGASALFDFDENGASGEQVYLVGSGAPAPSLAVRDHADVTFFFDPAVCTGQSSATIGVVVAKPPHGVLADLQPEQGGLVQVGARAPELSQTAALDQSTVLYVAVAVVPLPGPAQRAEARRQVMLDQIREVTTLVERGLTQPALHILSRLRSRMDGVGEDWIQDDPSTRVDERARVLAILDDLVTILEDRRS